MKTRHYIIIAVLVILLVIWWLFSAQIKAWLSPQKAAAKAAIVSAPPKPGLDYNKVLKNGVYNSPEVAQLQEWLGGLAIDGDFGPLTEAALRDRIHFSETTLASFTQLISQQQDITEGSALDQWSNTPDNSLFQPFSGFGLTYVTS